MKLTVKDTGKYGKGVFAGEDIKKGTVLHVLDGKRMDVTDVVAQINSKKENIDDPFQIGKRTYIDLDEFSRTFNHSCEPTGGIRKNSELFAIRDIKKGEEITYDYSMTIAPTDWKMKCICGSKKCRHVLGDVSTVPRAQVEEYRKVGAIQRYMKAILKELKDGVYKVPKYELAALEKLGNNKYTH